jgi:MerR family transcriptional regulator/heat shock protein HspR
MEIPQPDPDRGVYGITVAAELVGSGPQNLRQYEARGLVTPQRTVGGTRRYSENDLTRLRDIAGLLDAGLNLAGIEMVLALRTANSQLQAQIDKLTGQQAAASRSKRATGRGQPPADAPGGEAGLDAGEPPPG